MEFDSEGVVDVKICENKNDEMTNEMTNEARAEVTDQDRVDEVGSKDWVTHNEMGDL